MNDLKTALVQKLRHLQSISKPLVQKYQRLSKQMKVPKRHAQLSSNQIKLHKQISRWNNKINENRRILSLLRQQLQNIQFKELKEKELRLAELKKQQKSLKRVMPAQMRDLPSFHQEKNHQILQQIKQITHHNKQMSTLFRNMSHQLLKHNTQQSKSQLKQDYLLKDLKKVQTSGAPDELQMKCLNEQLQKCQKQKMQMIGQMSVRMQQNRRTVDRLKEQLERLTKGKGSSKILSKSE